VQVGIPRETTRGERRVALVPESVSRLGTSGLSILVEAGAGETAGRPDAAYVEAGARIGDAAEVWASDVIAKVRPPSLPEIDRLNSGAVLVALLEPAGEPARLEALAARGATALALEWVPRIARAQSMDVLSSMSTIAGYKAVLMAADRFPRFLPLLMTAAGTIQPARVLIVGAGVAGLQAIATARRLGATVEAFDPRPAAREQVESLGARFVGAELLDATMETKGGYAREQTEEEKARQREALRGAVAQADILICSALVAGRRAPVVVDEAMVRAMRPGTVIVDLAAEQGGNCALTQAGEEVERFGVFILGPLDLTSRMAFDASRMFSRNITSLLQHIVREGALIALAEDEIARACLVAQGGRVWSAGQPLAAAASGGGAA
jgi:proton-translocating NAD(P)+ transhydrogenase subunit alpha